MKYYTVDYKANLKELTYQTYLKQMNKDDSFVAFENSTHLLVTDSANDIEIVKNAILKMLQEYIYFDI